MCETVDLLDFDYGDEVTELDLQSISKLIGVPFNVLKLDAMGEDYNAICD